MSEPSAAAVRATVERGASDFPTTWKPYDRRQAKRDIHDAGIVSHKMSAFVRCQKKAAEREVVPPDQERSA